MMRSSKKSDLFLVGVHFQVLLKLEAFEGCLDKTRRTFLLEAHGSNLPADSGRESHANLTESCKYSVLKA